MREYIIVILISCIITSLFWAKTCDNREKIFVIHDTIKIENEIDKDKLCEAFAYVESRNNVNAINEKTKATGILQIMPILIDEANRLEGYDKYKLSDRTNKEKSFELFHLIMQHKNPTYDIHLACKLWNPRCKLSYHREIENKYYELINN